MSLEKENQQTPSLAFASQQQEAGWGCCLGTVRLGGILSEILVPIPYGGNFAATDRGPPARLQLTEGGLCEVELLCHVHPAYIVCVLCWLGSRTSGCPYLKGAGQEQRVTILICHTCSLTGCACLCLILRGPTSQLRKPWLREPE